MQSEIDIKGENMILSDVVADSLKQLGARLREVRLKRNESQQVFAARIGVSRPTLNKMEVGDPTVQLGFWAAALDVLGRAEEFKALLAPPEDLFAKYEQTRQPVRRRAPRKRTP
jgi:transcriptional regulator with XRE-family HTH domain